MRNGSTPKRESYTCSRPFCGRKFLAVTVRNAPVCPECRAEDERERVRRAKQEERARRRQSLAKPGI